MSVGESWIGVDLDGTLVLRGDWSGDDHVGRPIPKMVERVRKWLSDGMRVKIFTARYTHCQKNPSECDRVCAPIRLWCETYLGQALEITNVKDYMMIELWDDRAVAVEPDTGEIACNREDHR